MYYFNFNWSFSGLILFLLLEIIEILLIIIIKEQFEILDFPKYDKLIYSNEYYYNMQVHITKIFFANFKSLIVKSNVALNIRKMYLNKRIYVLSSKITNCQETWQHLNSTMTLFHLFFFPCSCDMQSFLIQAYLVENYQKHKLY